MTVPSTTWTEITSTTLADYRPTLADNVLTHIPLLKRLMEKGNVDESGGGQILLENILYNSNSTFSWYNGYSELSTAASDTMTAAQYDWKQANCNITISGREKMQNTEESAKIRLITGRILGAEKTMQLNVGAAMFYSTTENSGFSIGGLQALVADSPSTGTVGGIDRSAQTWWRNQSYSFSGNSVTASATTIQHALNLQWHKTLRGNDKVDMIVGGLTYYTYYLESLQTQQRFTNEKGSAGAGFPGGIKYNTADVFYDPNETTGTRLYLLNTDYFFLRPHKDRNFVTDKEKASTNQDATVIPVYWGGNLTLANANLQGLVCS